MNIAQIILATKTRKNNEPKKFEKKVPDPDPDPDLEISNFSSGAPCFCPVAHLRHLGVAHHEASSGALPGAPLLSQIAMAHH
jgi:hypothetical protein